MANHISDTGAALCYLFATVPGRLMESDGKDNARGAQPSSSHGRKGSHVRTSCGA